LGKTTIFLLPFHLKIKYFKSEAREGGRKEIFQFRGKNNLEDRSRRNSHSTNYLCWLYQTHKATIVSLELWKELYKVQGEILSSLSMKEKLKLWEAGGGGGVGGKHMFQRRKVVCPFYLILN
jgi:hypothetical protein